jgi:hypothetical protein
MVTPLTAAERCERSGDSSRAARHECTRACHAPKLEDAARGLYRVRSVPVPQPSGHGMRNVVSFDLDKTTFKSRL